MKVSLAIACNEVRLMIRNSVDESLILPYACRSRERSFIIMTGKEFSIPGHETTVLYSTYPNYPSRKFKLYL